MRLVSRPGSSLERERLRERQALQLRRELIGPRELALCLHVLTFLAKCQAEIVVRLGVAWLEPRRLRKFRLCLVDILGLQQHQPEIVMALGKFRIVSHEIAKDIGGGSGIVVLAQGESELYSGIDTLR